MMTYSICCHAKQSVRYDEIDVPDAFHLLHQSHLANMCLMKVDVFLFL